MVIITSITNGWVRALWLTGDLADGREDQGPVASFTGRLWRELEPAKA